MNLHNYNKSASKAKPLPVMAFYILVLLIFSIILGGVVTRRSVADVHECDLERFFAESSRLITENWCDGFIESIVFTIDDTYIYVDGTLVEIEPGASTAPVIIYNQMFVPIYPLLEATNTSLYDIYEAPITINDTPMMCVDIIARSMGFELDWNPESQEITLTRDFQTRRLIISATDDAVFHYIGATDIVKGPGSITVLQFATIYETQNAYAWLYDMPYVEWVEPDSFLPPVEVNTVYEYISPFNHHSWGVERSRLNYFANFLHHNNRNRQIIVAVVDTGVQSSHYFLQGRMLSGWCMMYNHEDYSDVFTVSNGHGTQVAGVIVDSTPGLSVKILPVRVFDSNRGGTVLSLTNGIRWAASRSDVINVSAGGRGNYQMVIDAVLYAKHRNVAVVAAAGNSRSDAGNYTPAHIPWVITVAASNGFNNPADFTNWGPAINLSAPGVSIRAAAIDGGYIHTGGTSLAAPHVSAAAAMYLMLRPGICPAGIQASLMRYVHVPPGWGYRYGTGILDMSRAVYYYDPSPHPVIILGDVTGTGVVTAADVAMLRAYLAGYPVEIVREAADITGSGSITAADIAMLRAYLAGYPVMGNAR